jgi:hypothetical protein
MSTAQVANTGIVGTTGRVMQPRQAVASSMDFVDPLSESYAPPARDHTPGFDDDQEEFATPRRRRRKGGPFQDRVVSFGGVLVSREVGATIMQAQAALTARSGAPLGAAEAERGIAVYEYNQALMGNAQIMSDFAFTR